MGDDLAGKTIATLIGAIAGWLFKLIQDRSDTRRRDVVNKVKEIISDVYKYSLEGCLYWSGSGADQDCVKISTNIKAIKSRVSNDIEWLNKTKNNSERFLKTYLIKLNQSITGGDFEVITRQPELGKPALILEAQTKLVNHLRVIYDIL